MSKKNGEKKEPRGYTIFLYQKPALQMASTVDLVKQWLDHLELIKKGKAEAWEPVKFMEEDGHVTMAIHPQYIMGVMEGIQVPQTPPVYPHMSGMGEIPPPPPPKTEGS